MIISARADHALQIIQYLAAQPDDRVFSMQSIMDALRVPVRHTTPILRRLSRAGLLSSRRGLYGGYNLARPAGEITYLEVIEAIEDGSGIAREDECPCVVCKGDKKCHVHINLARLRGLLREQLRELTF